MAYVVCRKGFFSVSISLSKDNENMVLGRELVFPFNEHNLQSTMTTFEDSLAFHPEELEKGGILCVSAGETRNKTEL